MVWNDKKKQNFEEHKLWNRSPLCIQYYIKYKLINEKLAQIQMVLNNNKRHGFWKTNGGGFKFFEGSSDIEFSMGVD